MKHHLKKVRLFFLPKQLQQLLLCDNLLHFRDFLQQNVQKIIAKILVRNLPKLESIQICIGVD